MGDPGVDEIDPGALVRWADSVWARAPRDRITVEGPDAERYLHSQLAQDIASMTVPSPKRLPQRLSGNR